MACHRVLPWSSKTGMAPTLAMATRQSYSVLNSDNPASVQEFFGPSNQGVAVHFLVASLTDVHIFLCISDLWLTT